MRKTHLLLLTAVLFLSSCGGDYDAERMLYNVTRLHSQTLRSPVRAAEKDFDGALKDLKGVIDKYPAWSNAADLQLMLGELNSARGRVSAAAGEFEKVIVDYPDRHDVTVRAWYALGQLKENAGKIKEAVAEYEKIMDRYPTSEFGLQMPVYVADLYSRSGMKDKSKEAYENAFAGYKSIVETNPYSKIVSAVHPLMVITGSKLGRASQTAEYLLSFAAKYPKAFAAPQSLLEAAKIYSEALKNNARALEIFSRTVKEYGKSKYAGEAQLAIGNIYALKGDYAGAAAVRDKVNKLFPKDGSLRAAAQFAVAVSYDKAGRWQEALPEYDKLRSEFPDKPVAMQVPLIIAGHYVKKNDKAGANRSFEEAVKYYKSLTDDKSADLVSLEAFELLAATYIMKEEYAAAVETLKAIRSKFPADKKSEFALFKIAMIYENNLKNKALAAETYKEFVKQYPAGSLSLSAVGRIRALEKRK